MALKNSTSSFGYTSSDYSYMDEEDDIGVDEIEFYESSQDDNIESMETFTILTKEQIFEEQMEQISKISELFEIPSTTARQLLTYMKWNTDRLIEKYYGGEAESLFRDGGIVDPRKINVDKLLEGIDELECSICYCTFSSDEIDGLPCGHFFCKYCWNSYLEIKIMQEGQAKLITCPGKNCNLLVDEMKITKLVNNEATLTRYKHLIAEAYVQDNANVRWCPGKGCDKAVRVQLLKDKEIVCSCGTKFCFSCGREYHEPADCKMVNDWLLKSERDGSNDLWIASYTKECPKCNYKIVKDGGCQYIVCSNCKHRFCWICLGSFDHTNHACNQYKEENIPDNRREINKYAHFFNRYKIHEDSKSKEELIKVKIQNEMNRLINEEKLNWIDVKYLEDAYEQLQESRSMLKWTYVYGYYLPKNINRGLFEFLQAELEAETEKLSELLESKEEIEKKRITSATNLVKRRIDKLIEGLAEGEITGGSNDENYAKYASVQKYSGWIYTNNQQ